MLFFYSFNFFLPLICLHSMSVETLLGERETYRNNQSLVCVADSSLYLHQYKLIANEGEILTKFDFISSI